MFTVSFTVVDVCLWLDLTVFSLCAGLCGALEPAELARLGGKGWKQRPHAAALDVPSSSGENRGGCGSGWWHAAHTL